MSTKTALHAAKPSRFDLAAEEITELIVEGEDAAFEDVWNIYLPRSFIRASPRNTQKGPGLLDLPTEIRLMIYEQLTLKDEYFGYSPEPMHLASLMHWDEVPRFEHFARKSWSWILAHPIIFMEAIKMVVAAYPVILYSTEDLHNVMHSMQKVERLILDLGKVSRATIRNVLRLVGTLPEVEYITIRAESSTVKQYRLPRNPNHWKGSFQGCRMWQISIELPKHELEEAKFDHEITYGQQYYNDAIRAYEEELKSYQLNDPELEKVMKLTSTSVRWRKLAASHNPQWIQALYADERISWLGYKLDNLQVGSRDSILCTCRCMGPTTSQSQRWQQKQTTNARKYSKKFLIESDIRCRNETLGERQRRLYERNCLS